MRHAFDAQTDRLSEDLSVLEHAATRATGRQRTPHRMLAAPCCTDRGAFLPPISVRTQPGLIALTRMLRGASLSANSRAIALSAALLAA